MSFEFIAIIVCFLALVGLAMGIYFFTGISSETLWLVLLILTSLLSCLIW